MQGDGLTTPLRKAEQFPQRFILHVENSCSASTVRFLGSVFPLLGMNTLDTTQQLWIFLFCQHEEVSHKLVLQT